MPGFGVHVFASSIAPYASEIQSAIALVENNASALATLTDIVLPTWLANVTLSAGDAAREAAVISAAQAVIDPVSGQGSVLHSGLPTIASQLQAILQAGSATVGQIDAIAGSLSQMIGELQSAKTSAIPGAVQGAPDDPDSINSLVQTAQNDIAPVVNSLYGVATNLTGISQLIGSHSPIVSRPNPPFNPGGGGSGSGSGQGQQKPSGGSWGALVAGLFVVGAIGGGIYWMHTHPRASHA